METNEILDRLQEKIVEIHNEANESLKRLNERENERLKHINGMYDCDLSYYRDVARYAWADRAKQIAMLDMQSFLNELRKELKQ